MSSAEEPQAFAALRTALREWRRGISERIDQEILGRPEARQDLMCAPGIDEQRQLLPLPAWIYAEPPSPPVALVPPLAHTWETRTLAAGLTVECCVHGDAVRRRDGRELPCRGPQHIDLRSTL